VHPLVRWMRHVLTNRGSSFHPVSAISIDGSQLSLPKGTWAYAVQLWGFRGLRVRQYLAYKAISLSDRQVLDLAAAERLIVGAARSGRPWNGKTEATRPEVLELIKDCETSLDNAFGDKVADYDAENASICSQQGRTARRMADRKCAGLEERIENYRKSNKVKMIPALEGQVRAEKARLADILRRIAERSRLNPEQSKVANGVIQVE
jgi:hypothetical protein